MTSQPHSKKTRPLAALAFKLPPMIDCVAFENFIIGYFDKTLSARQKFVFELHMKMCRECRDYLKAYKSTIILANQQSEISLGDMGLEDVPEDLIDAVIKAAKEN